ncbi:hypothetical protein L1049_017967 [Liquidambar formosana]|uniref:Beta-glucosidase n=1 Tax=Liquidambar formosana TaxID=63359 RepID=A0AAP0NHW8_LIQFO
MAMSNGKAFAPNEDTATLNRSSFPAGFIFGTATSAYQIEGAANEGGRKPCIWDTFSQCPGKIKDGSSGNVACDSYHRYKEDVGIMKDIGFEAYRFSISWSRVLPDGKLSGGVNKEGISYYNNLINELIANGLEPFVTLFHWDLPQTLEDEYGGFLSPKVVEDFRDYADLCYKEFGDRVKHWITLNEPWTFTNNGYATGHFAPGRCSQWQQKNCDSGDSGTEPYLVSHHSLLAHAAAVQVYRKKYQAASDWLFIYPNGIRELLLYTKRKYNNPIIYITENGMDETNDETLSLEEALADNHRVDYYHQHLSSIQSAIEEGVDVRGYFAWSLLDNFEWDLGYSVRFGINYVDYKDGLKRYPKLSAKCCKAITPTQDTASLNRSSFPAGFIFGTASSAYQYEGAANGGGRGPSIWDTFTQRYPGKIMDGSNGNMAVDSYHRYKEDVGIIKDTGFDAYRFSISWSRLLPHGKLSGGVNEEGIRYYNNLINELVANGIQPFVTLFHWDLPQALEDEYGGFLSPRIADDFRDYADLCYREFGDRVKHWITLNEPWTFSIGGYAMGQFAPGRCSEWQHRNCTGGDSGIEPYLVSHHQLLAHAAAVQVYKQKYQASQKGKIGITLVSLWVVPFSDAKHHHNAAERALDFILNASYFTDFLVNLTAERNGVPIGAKAASDWLYVYPRGIQDLLLYTKRKYNNPTIYITENGIDEMNNGTLSLKEALADNVRIDYYHRHLSFLQRAIKDGVDVRGYFAWSLLDNFEWYIGYSVRFGINYVDFNDGLKRYPKFSATWFKNFLKK